MIQKKTIESWRSSLLLAGICGSCLMSILFLGIFCSGLAYLFWYSALEKRDSSIVGIYLYLIPFIKLIGAYLLLDEEIHWITLVGRGMVPAGVYLATRKTSRTLMTKILTSLSISGNKCRWKD